MVSKLLTTLITLALSSKVLALDNGLAIKPQMGWNSWNNYGCNITEDVIKQNGKAMVDEGLLELGYNYLVIDDCYQLKERDPDTKKIQPDPTKFPNGLKNVTDALHQDGLLVGIYS
jgi:alpha-galactosidase